MEVAFHCYAFDADDDGPVVFTLGFETPQFSVREDDVDTVTAEVCVSSRFEVAQQNFSLTLIETPSDSALNPGTGKQQTLNTR